MNELVLRTGVDRPEIASLLWRTYDSSVNLSPAVESAADHLPRSWGRSRMDFHRSQALHIGNASDGAKRVRGAEAVSSGRRRQFDGRQRSHTDSQVANEISVFNSEDIMNAVANPGEIEKHFELEMSRDQLQQRAKAVRELRSELDILPVRGSHVIDVRLTARSPEQARDTLNLLLQVFLQKQRELARLPGASHVFGDEVNQYQQQLQQAREQLANFQQSSGFVSSSSQEDALQAKLLETQGAQRDADAQISELQHRISADRKSS